MLGDQGQRKRDQWPSHSFENANVQHETDSWHISLRKNEDKFFPQLQ